MKTILQTLAAILLSSINSFSQKGMVKFQVGYGLPLTSTHSLAGSSTVVNGSTTTFTGAYGSYGSGLRLEAGYIHPFNERLHLEMDITYLFGKPIESTYKGSGSTQSQSSSSRFYEFSPLLRVNLGGNKIKPYAAIGPVFGLGTITDTYKASSTSGTNSGEAQVEYTGSVAIGAKSAVGAEFTQGKFVFYAQLTLIGMSYSPDKSEVTKYIFNGTDQLPSFTTADKQTVYRNSYTVANGGPDPNKPKEELKIFIPYSNVSLNVGVMFKL